MNRAACMLALWALGGASAAAEPEARLITDDSGALIELQGENQLLLRGLQGTLALRAGKPGELRYETRTRDNLRQPRPVALWLEGRKLRLEPVAGDEGLECLIELTVPPELAVEIQADSSVVSAYGLHGGFRFSGSKSELMTRGLTGKIDVELTGGKVQLSGSVETLRLEAKDAAITIDSTAGPVQLVIARSTLTLSGSRDVVEGEIEGTTFEATDVEGLLRLTAVESKLSLVRANGGASLDLGTTPLVMEQTRGDVDVVTDASVSFTRHEGALKVLGYGAEVTGTGSAGRLDLETDNAKVHLQQIGAGGEVRGRDLDLQVLGAAGELTLRTTGSKLALKRVEGPLTIDSELGTVEVLGAAAPVSLTSRNTDVRLLGLKARLTLEAEGGEVEVGWRSFQITEDVSVENTNGGLRVYLPHNASVRIDAETRSGRIEADLPGVEISEDGHSASGLVSEGRVAPQAKRPALVLRAADDLYIGFGGEEP